MTLHTATLRMAESENNIANSPLWKSLFQKGEKRGNVFRQVYIMYQTNNKSLFHPVKTPGRVQGEPKKDRIMLRSGDIIYSACFSMCVCNCVIYLPADARHHLAVSWSEFPHANLNKSSFVQLNSITYYTGLI